MKQVTWILVLVSLLAFSNASFAQERVQIWVNQAVQYDLSPPLAELALMAGPVVPLAGDYQVPLRIVSGLPPRGSDPHADPRLQRVPLGDPTPPVIENFAGLGQVSGVTPPDTDGDVGLDFIVQWNNLAIAIWDKDNPNAGPIFGPVDGNTIFAGFGGPCENTNNGDPIVFFDHLVSRWFLSQFAINQGTQCIAISTTSDPQGPYHRYAFVPVAGQNNDYPHCGLWVDSYLCTYRMFPSGVSPFATFTALNRGKMLVGDPTAEQVVAGLACDPNNCPDGVQPVHLQGPPPPAGPALFLKDWDDDFNATGADPDGYRMWELDVDWANPGAATFTELPRAVGTDWDQDMCGFFVRACVEQPAPATPANFLDPIDELTMWRAVYRHFDSHDAIVLTHTVDATGGDVAAMRWAELRPAGGAAWNVFQQSVFSPSDDDRWMGSSAMDGDGNIGLAYSVSSTIVEPSVRYAARAAGDPLDMLRPEVELIAGTGVNTSGTNRWGDYSVLTIDPEDDCTFWMFQEFMEVTGVSTYSTRIGSFRFPDCAGRPVIFVDGFESGDTGVWSTTAP